MKLISHFLLNYQAIQLAPIGRRLGIIDPGSRCQFSVDRAGWVPWMRWSGRLIANTDLKVKHLAKNKSSQLKPRRRESIHPLSWGSHFVESNLATLPWRLYRNAHIPHPLPDMRRPPRFRMSGPRTGRVSWTPRAISWALRMRNSRIL